MSKFDYVDRWPGMKEVPHDLEQWRRERIERLPEVEFKREYLNQMPELEDQVKPNTCGSCRSFEPPKDDPDWRYRVEAKDRIGRPVEGTCRNGVACLGAVLPTGRDSRCNYFAPRSDG